MTLLDAIDAGRFDGLLALAIVGLLFYVLTERRALRGR